MKVIAFEEHYKIPAIAQANKDNPIEQIYEKWQKLGRFPGNPSQGVPPGIYDLDEKRIAAMDAAARAAVRPPSNSGRKMRMRRPRLEPQTFGPRP